MIAFFQHFSKKLATNSKNSDLCANNLTSTNTAILSNQNNPHFINTGMSSENKMDFNLDDNIYFNPEVTCFNINQTGNVNQNKDNLSNPASGHELPRNIEDFNAEAFYDFVFSIRIIEDYIENDQNFLKALINLMRNLRDGENIVEIKSDIISIFYLHMVKNEDVLKTAKYIVKASDINIFTIMRYICLLSPQDNFLKFILQGHYEYHEDIHDTLNNFMNYHIFQNIVVQFKKNLHNKYVTSPANFKINSSNLQNNRTMKCDNIAGAEGNKLSTYGNYNLCVSCESNLNKNYKYNNIISSNVNSTLLDMLKVSNHFRTYYHIVFPFIINFPGLISPKILVELLDSLYKLINNTKNVYNVFAVNALKCFYNRFKNVLLLDSNAYEANLKELLIKNFCHNTLLIKDVVNETNKLQKNQFSNTQHNGNAGCTNNAIVDSELIDSIRNGFNSVFTVLFNNFIHVKSEEYKIIRKFYCKLTFSHVSIKEDALNNHALSYLIQNELIKGIVMHILEHLLSLVTFNFIKTSNQIKTHHDIILENQKTINSHIYNNTDLNIYLKLFWLGFDRPAHFIYISNQFGSEIDYMPYNFKTAYYLNNYIKTFLTDDLIKPIFVSHIEIPVLMNVLNEHISHKINPKTITYIYCHLIELRKRMYQKNKLSVDYAHSNENNNINISTKNENNATIDNSYDLQSDSNLNLQSISKKIISIFDDHIKIPENIEMFINDTLLYNLTVRICYFFIDICPVFCNNLIKYYLTLKFVPEIIKLIEELAKLDKGFYFENFMDLLDSPKITIHDKISFFNNCVNVSKQKYFCSCNKKSINGNSKDLLSHPKKNDFDNIYSNAITCEYFVEMLSMQAYERKKSEDFFTDIFYSQKHFLFNNGQENTNSENTTLSNDNNQNDVNLNLENVTSQYDNHLNSENTVLSNDNNLNNLSSENITSQNDNNLNNLNYKNITSQNDNNLNNLNYDNITSQNENNLNNLNYENITSQNDKNQNNLNLENITSQNDNNLNNLNYENITLQNDNNQNNLNYNNVTSQNENNLNNYKNNTSQYENNLINLNNLNLENITLQNDYKNNTSQYENNLNNLNYNNVTSQYENNLNNYKNNTSQYDKNQNDYKNNTSQYENNLINLNNLNLENITLQNDEKTASSIINIFDSDYEYEKGFFSTIPSFIRIYRSSSDITTCKNSLCYAKRILSSKAYNYIPKSPHNGNFSSTQKNEKIDSNSNEKEDSDKTLQSINHTNESNNSITNKTDFSALSKIREVSFYDLSSNHGFTLDETSFYGQLLKFFKNHPELRFSLQKAFLMGLKSSDNNVRYQYFDFFNSTLNKDLFSRLRYLMAFDWSFYGISFIHPLVTLLMQKRFFFSTFQIYVFGDDSFYEHIFDDQLDMKKCMLVNKDMKGFIDQNIACFPSIVSKYNYTDLQHIISRILYHHTKKFAPVNYIQPKEKTKINEAIDTDDTADEYNTHNIISSTSETLSSAMFIAYFSSILIRMSKTEIQLLLKDSLKCIENNINPTIIVKGWVKFFEDVVKLKSDLKNKIKQADANSNTSPLNIECVNRSLNQIILHKSEYPSNRESSHMKENLITEHNENKDSNDINCAKNRNNISNSEIEQTKCCLTEQNSNNKNNKIVKEDHIKNIIDKRKNTDICQYSLIDFALKNNINEDYCDELIDIIKNLFKNCNYLDIARKTNTFIDILQIIPHEHDVYRILNETNLYYGSIKKYIDTDIINLIIKSQYEEAQEKLEISQEKYNDTTNDSANVVLAIMEEEWIQCAKKLQQWDVLNELSNITGDMQLNTEVSYHILEEKDINSVRSLLKLRKNTLDKRFMELITDKLEKFQSQSLNNQARKYESSEALTNNLGLNINYLDDSKNIGNLHIRPNLVNPNNAAKLNNEPNKQNVENNTNNHLRNYQNQSSQLLNDFSINSDNFNSIAYSFDHRKNNDTYISNGSKFDRSANSNLFNISDNIKPINMNASPSSAQSFYPYDFTSYNHRKNDKFSGANLKHNAFVKNDSNLQNSQFYKHNITDTHNIESNKFYLKLKCLKNDFLKNLHSYPMFSQNTINLLTKIHILDNIIHSEVNLYNTSTNSFGLSNKTKFQSKDSLLAQKMLSYNILEKTDKAINNANSGPQFIDPLNVELDILKRDTLLNTQVKTDFLLPFSSTTKKAKIYNSFSKKLIENDLNKQALYYLQKIFMLPNIEVIDMFYKIKLEVQALLNLKRFDAALNVCNSANLLYFDTQTKSEMFKIKASILEKKNLHYFNKQNLKKDISSIFLNNQLSKKESEYLQTLKKGFLNSPNKHSYSVNKASIDKNDTGFTSHCIKKIDENVIENNILNNNHTIDFNKKNLPVYCSDLSIYLFNEIEKIDEIDNLLGIAVKFNSTTENWYSWGCYLDKKYQKYSNLLHASLNKQNKYNLSLDVTNQTDINFLANTHNKNTSNIGIIEQNTHFHNEKNKNMCEYDKDSLNKSLDSILSSNELQNLEQKNQQVSNSINKLMRNSLMALVQSALSNNGSVARKSILRMLKYLTVQDEVIEKHILDHVYLIDAKRLIFFALQFIRLLDCEQTSCTYAFLKRILESYPQSIYLELKAELATKMYFNKIGCDQISKKTFLNDTNLANNKIHHSKVAKEYHLNTKNESESSKQIMFENNSSIKQNNVESLKHTAEENSISNSFNHKKHNNNESNSEISTSVQLISNLLGKTSLRLLNIFYKISRTTDALVSALENSKEEDCYKMINALFNQSISLVLNSSAHGANILVHTITRIMKTLNITLVDKRYKEEFYNDFFVKSEKITK
ncbi:hypothetical protein EDEG_00384, partial [Edhazardia aedis USNM 41457]